LLETVGVPEGGSCLDVACGGGDVSIDISKLIGPSGSVLGVDFDETKIGIAQEEAKQRGIDNVSFQSLDVNELDVDGQFDLVYVRFLLTHLDNSAEVLNKIIRAAKFGGVVVIEDIDVSGRVCYPPCEAFDRYLDFYNRTVRKRGGDPDIGHKLPKMVLDAGLDQMQFQAIQPTFMDVGDGKLLSLVTLETIAPAVFADELASEDEFQAIYRDFKDFIHQPDTIVSLPRIFQVWGYRK
jgi:ubiquinone/menaquinone biosynthesis C-methylase UbiE